MTSVLTNILEDYLTTTPATERFPISKTTTDTEYDTETDTRIDQRIIIKLIQEVRESNRLSLLRPCGVSASKCGNGAEVTEGSESPHTERVRSEGSWSEGTSASTYKKLRPFVFLSQNFRVRKSAEECGAEGGQIR